MLKTLYEFRSNIFEKSYKLGRGKFSLILDNSYSSVTDKSVSIHIVSKWKIKTPTQDLPIVNREIMELPSEVFEAVSKANECYVSGHYEQCSVMFRKGIDSAIRLKLLQSGMKEEDLLDEQGNELTLSKKIKLLRGRDLISQITAKHLDDAKWYGDLGAHSKMRFVLEDIKDNLEPKVRAFLAGLSLRI